MAPEGWRLETNTTQLDMYAMGIVLFEMATLQYPYDRPSDLRDLDAIRTMHFFSSPHTVTSLRPDLPIGFTHVVTRLLEKRAQDRFASWVEVADALSKVWEQCGHPNARLSSVVQALFEETSRQHQQLTQNRLEQKAADVTRKQQREIDVFQQHKLFSAIQEVIQEFNSHSTLGNISASSGGRVGGALSFYVKLPFDSTIQLDFFWIDPPLELKQGSVRFAGVVVGPRGYGYNYLLVRSGVTDIYGRWVICKVRQRKLPPRHEPFGFNNSSTIREIETAERAIHIYTVTFEEASADCFLQFALEIMRSWLPS